MKLKDRHLHPFRSGLLIEEPCHGWRHFLRKQNKSNITAKTRPMKYAAPIAPQTNLKINTMKLRVILLIWVIAIAGAMATKYTLSGSANANDSGFTLASDDMQGWSKASRIAANTMKKKYGEPTEKYASMMIWKNNGPWKKTIVFAKEHNHEFPMMHTDVMQQFIDYKVPPEKFDDLAMFDGSVVCNRTNGDISARCDKEEANFLALNLAHDIITGKKDVKSARDFYAKTVHDMINGAKPEYMQKLLFNTEANTADADKRSAFITDDDISKMKKMQEMQEKELETGMDIPH